MFRSQTPNKHAKLYHKDITIGCSTDILSGRSNSPLCRLRRRGEEEGARTPRAPAKGQAPFAIPFWRELESSRNGQERVAMSTTASVFVILAMPDLLLHVLLPQTCALQKIAATKPCAVWGG